MNVMLTRAWMEAGSPPLEDLGPALGMTDLDLVQYMNGRKYPDRGTQQLLADVLDKPVDVLFPQNGGNH